MENNEWFNKFKGRFCRDEKKIFIYDWLNDLQNRELRM